MGARGLVAWLVLVNLAMGVSAASDQAGVPVRTAGGNPPACSRERSRHARGVLDDFFHPVADRNRFRLPPNCPFDRSKDMYLEHEKHKEVVRRTQYKSLYSDKTFYSEHYVDKHMDNRHMDKVPPGADVCLADYCEVLRCDEHQAWKHPELRKTIGSSASRARCSEEKMRGVRHFCEVLMSRCFPTSGVDDGGAVTAARLREYFTRHHCDMLTCDGVHDMFGVLGSHHAVREVEGTRWFSSWSSAQSASITCLCGTPCATGGGPSTSAGRGRRPWGPARRGGSSPCRRSCRLARG
jgi:hypothetical protein